MSEEKPELTQCAHAHASLGSDDGIWWCDNCGAPTTGFRQINLSNVGGGPKYGDISTTPGKSGE